MKILLSLFFALTVGSSNTWADNLLSYIEMPVSKQHLLAFSSQGIEFKECNTCPTIKLRPKSKVAHYEHNNLIDIKQATELFINKKHRSVSVFFDRTTNTYDKVVFGGHLEEESLTQPISERLEEDAL